MNLKEGEIYTGASGIVLPVPNKSLYPQEYQDKSRLTYYASLFNSIEVNSSFYKLPQAATVRKWSESVGQDFRFTFKLWKEITHNKGLVYNPENIYTYFDRVNAVGFKKGTILVQFAPSIDSQYFVELDRLFADIQRANTNAEWRIAVEFRHNSWYEEHVFELLTNYQVSLVIHDLPASATPLPDEPSDFMYLRFHGPSGGYRGSYADDFLAEYASYICDWKREGADVFVYFNNTMGDAVGNLLTLNSHIKSYS